MEERRNNSVLQTEFDGLKELITVKFDNFHSQNKIEHKQINSSIVNNGEIIKDHNGRLGIVEKIIEQGKGAGRVMQWGWIVFAFVVGGFIFPIIIRAIGI